jgi:hypothetical protein
VKPKPRSLPYSSADDMRELLQTIARPGEPRGQLWEYLRLSLGSAHAARAVVLASFDDLACVCSARVDSKRAARFADIIRRYDLDGNTTSEVSRALGIPPARFYKERRTALQRLAALIERRLPSAMGLQAATTLSLLELEIAFADTAERAGDPQRAIATLRSVLEGGVDRTGRIQILCRLVSLYARQGEHRLADRILAEARRALPETGEIAEHRSIELAEILLAAELEDYGRLSASAERIASDARWDEPILVEQNINVLCHLATAQLDSGHVAAGFATLQRINALVLKCAQVSVELRIRLLTLRAQVHLALPESIGLGRTEAGTALQLAAQQGFVREGWRALHTLVEHHLGTLDPPSELGYGRYLLRVAERAAEPRLILIASLVVASAEAQMGRNADARSRIASCAPLASSRTEIEKDLLEAFVLSRNGEYATALDLATHARQAAESRRLMNLVGVALLYESNFSAKSGNHRKALPSAFAAASALESGTRPFNLADAYLWIYRLTGEQRFRRRAHEIKSSFNAAKHVLRRVPQLNGGPVVNHDVFGGRLTARQSEVAQLVRAGRTNRGIGCQLGISESTVAHHVEALLRRLGLRARWQLSETTPVLPHLADSDRLA